MPENNKWKIVSLTVLLVFIMILIDGVLSIKYQYRALIKFSLFFLIPLILRKKVFSSPIKKLFKTDSKNTRKEIALGIIVYIFILISFFVFRNFFDFSKVTENITKKVGVNKNNFLYASLYISFFNSFIEEVFFRGFAFLKLKEVTKGNFALYFSSLFFSVYHVFIMNNWFNIYLFLLLIFSLFISGIIFGKLNEKSKSIYPSWIVHMFANFSINTVGFILFNTLL